MLFYFILLLQPTYIYITDLYVIKIKHHWSSALLPLPVSQSPATAYYVAAICHGLL